MKNQKSISQNYYFPFITGIKGYAALAIMGRHLFPYHTWGSLGDSIVASLAHFVTVFFFISGFTLTSSIMNKKRFQYVAYVKDRFLRLAPLYWCVCVIAFLFPELTFGKYYQGLMSIGRVDIFNLLHHLFFTNGIFVKYQNSLIGVEWSIPIEVTYYLLLPSMVFLAARSRAGAMLLVFLGVILKYYYLQIQLPIYIGGVYNDLWLVERYFVVFSLGIVWYILFFHKRSDTWKDENQINSVFLFVFSFLGFALTYKGSYHFEQFLLPVLVGISWYIAVLKPKVMSQIRWNFLRRVISIVDVFFIIPLFWIYMASPKSSFEIIISLFVGIILLLSRDQGRITRAIFENRLIVFIGTISYSIYLLHIPIIKTVGNFTFDFSTILLSFVATMSISFLSYRYIEIPGKKLRKYFFRKSDRL